MATEHAEHTHGEVDCMICHIKCSELAESKCKCEHKEFHEECINNWLKVGNSCPYCRAPKKGNRNRYDIINKIDEETQNPSIYIWHDWQTLPANIYRDSWNLNLEIKVIDQNNVLDLYNNDIVYNHT